MSSSAQQSFSASQFDQSYRPTRLGNWEVPKATTSKRPTFRGAGYTTKIIVDDNGHILPGKGKRQPEVEQLPEAHRWPEKAPLSSDRNRGAATMGCGARGVCVRRVARRLRGCFC